MGRLGETLSHLDEMWSAGVRIFTDDGTSVEDAGLLRLAMEYVAERGGVIAQHAEDRGFVPRRSHARRLGVLQARHARLPSVAEEVVVARDLALARLTGVRYHVQHLSSAGTVPSCARREPTGWTSPPK